MNDTLSQQPDSQPLDLEHGDPAIELQAPSPEEANDVSDFFNETTSSGNAIAGGLNSYRGSTKEAGGDIAEDIKKLTAAIDENEASATAMIEEAKRVEEERGFGFGAGDQQRSSTTEVETDADPAATALAEFASYSEKSNEGSLKGVEASIEGAHQAELIGGVAINQALTTHETSIAA